MLDSIRKLVVALAMIFGVIAVCSILITVLWNWLMPVIFELPEITYWQAFGLTVLLKLLIPHSSSSSK